MSIYCKKNNILGSEGIEPDNRPDDPLKKYFHSVGYQEMSKAVLQIFV